MMVYRPMTEADIPRGLALCRQAGWNQLKRDWEIFLALNPTGCLTAEENTLIGTAATLKYGDRFSWIGMVLVDKEFRGRGIGMELLRKALDLLKRERTVKLDATPAGRQLYLKLDFVDEYPLSRLHLPSINKIQTSSSVRRLQSNEWSKLQEIDLRVFGANRMALLEKIYEGSPELAFIVEDDQELTGYCMGRAGYHSLHIGPVVARNMVFARELVSAAMNTFKGRPVILDVPHFDPNWMEWLLSVGFEEQRPFYRMYRGENRFPGEPRNQFAILGPEFG